MSLGALDLVVFVGFVVAVVATGLVKSRKETTSEDYFLAGRGLRWWLIGFSLIAANISTEQFVGMSGNAASHVGLAIASYEWIAAVTLVAVAFGFLPYFLRAGIYTMPEFLEHRFNPAARTLMAVVTMFIYMLLLGSITYAGALTISTLGGKMGAQVPLFMGSVAIGTIAMVYVAAGGLKACAWADLIQGTSLILGGAAILVFALLELGSATEAARIVDPRTSAAVVEALSPSAGALERFWDLNAVRMNMFLPAADPVIPWTALIVAMWIPNLYYWGFNQYITQRTLGSASLAHGQRGIVFAAFLKLLTPFVIVIPGIIAFNLFWKDMQVEAAADNATILAKYLKSHPDTLHVRKVDAAADGAVPTPPPGTYTIAVVPDGGALPSARDRNPYMLPLARKTFEEIEAGPYCVFESDDAAWDDVNPGLAEEMAAHNARVREAAAAAGRAVTVEKPIAYKYDTGLGQLIGSVLPQRVGLVGFVLAALLGAVVSSLAALLNAASTIFAMDIYKKLLAPRASQHSVVRVGRTCVFGFTFVAIVLAPQLGNPKVSNSIFTLIIDSQMFIAAGIVAAFFFGIAVRRAPRSAGVASLLVNIVAYGALKWSVPSIQFLNRTAICFVLCLGVMALLTAVRPLPFPIAFERRSEIDMKGSRGAAIGGAIVVLITAALYVIFSPLGVAN